MAVDQFRTISGAIAELAARLPERRALMDAGSVLDYATLHARTVRIAAGLQRDGICAGAPVAIIGDTDVDCTAIFLGALCGGYVPTPMAPSSTAEQLAAMIADSGAPVVFAAAKHARTLLPLDARLVLIEELERWCPPDDGTFRRVDSVADDAFDMIYSSGTTGRPKGIVHSHGMRHEQVMALDGLGFQDAVTLIATPLYSNTTMVPLLATLFLGGTAVLLGRFDARCFLEVAERERVTHTMLVPVQYQRLMVHPDFDAFDLSSFQLKSCTGAPFAPDLKSEIVRRWPGSLLEIYGTTEGGGTCLLRVECHPDKLHTVGQPISGHSIRMIDGSGREVEPGGAGEIVGRSPLMMVGYHGQPTASDAATWLSPQGERYLRHGDVGTFDDDGFLILLGRTKDMIVSGGFNVYPVDIEAAMLEHPDVVDAAVVGIPSAAWGETPFGYYVPSRADLDPDALLSWVNARLGKTQRLSGVEAVDELPRNAMGKILKRALRDHWGEGVRPAMEGE